MEFLGRVIVEQDKDWNWKWTAYAPGGEVRAKSEGRHFSRDGALRAAKKVASPEAWPVMVVPQRRAGAH